jgi:hypothetical protein
MDYAFVEYVILPSYEVTFYVLKPHRVKTQQVVKANSESGAKTIIYGQYGKENVQIVRVKKQ